MAGSAKQARLVRAIEHDPAFAAKVAGGREIVPQLTSPGGVVQSGGYLGDTKFKTPSMPGLRKAR